MINKNLLKNTDFKKYQLQLISNDAKVKFIILSIEQLTGIRYKDFKEKSRKRIFTIPRQLCMHFIKQNTKYSLDLIGSYLGGRNHATVLHAISVVSDLLETDRYFKLLFNDIQEKIKGFIKPESDSKTEVFKELLSQYVEGEEMDYWIKRYTNSI